MLPDPDVDVVEEHAPVDQASTGQPQDVEAARAAFAEALRYRERDMRPQAADACRRVLGHDPHHADAWRLLASLSWLQGRPAEAVDLLQRASLTVPQNAHVHAELGLARLALDRPGDALPALSRALELSPALPLVQQALGSALRRLGRTGEAEAAYRRALQLDPRCAAACRELGELLLAAGRLPEARQSLEAALQIEPRSMPALTLLGKTLLLLGDHPGAVARYRAAAAADPANALTHVNLGLALRVSGDIEGSAAAFREAIAVAPRNADAHAHLADALLYLGRPADAVASAREAIRLHPTSSHGRIALGTALAAAGDIEAGAAEMRHAVPAGTAAGEIFSLLGQKLVDAGAEAASLASFRKALEVDPDNALARHLVAARTGVGVERDSSGYVRSLFDSYADTFDEHLQDLGYGTPQKLVSAIIATTQWVAPWDCLDLGCGTGLFGLEIASKSRRLVGVDVSAKMLGRARQRDIYTELRCTDLLTALESEAPGSYDLVAAADVFVYVGSLDAIVPAVRSVLRRGGIFAFSAEAADKAATAASETDPGFFAGIRGRYTHSLAYLNGLARRNGFEVLQSGEAAIRTEDGRPVMGWLLIWRAADFA